MKTIFMQKKVKLRQKILNKAKSDNPRENKKSDLKKKAHFAASQWQDKSMLFIKLNFRFT